MNFDFDLGFNSNRSKPLNAQKNNTYTQPKPNTNTTSYWQSSSLDGPTSMVGDITGRSWAASAPQRCSNTSGSSIGIVNKDTSLFSDLVGSNLVGKGNGGCNVPLKSFAPVLNRTSSKSAYSMGGVTDSLLKPGGSGGSCGSWGSLQGFGNIDTSGYGTESNNIGGPSMKSLNASGVGGGVNLNKDLFGSLVDFSSMPAGVITENKTAASMKTGSGIGSESKVDDFGFGGMQSERPVQSLGWDDFDVLFGNGSKGSETVVNQHFRWAEAVDESEVGGGGDVGGATELEGLPPPPAGVTSSFAKSKGMDYYKAGRYPDAIKWLSWAVILLEKAGDNVGTMEVLSYRALCYKEVGEYKKAVADCSKVLRQDGKYVAVLVQRALLYESMEKYKLGVEDLRIVMNIDPGNRIARSTIHRLNKLATAK